MIDPNRIRQNAPPEEGVTHLLVRDIDSLVTAVASNVAQQVYSAATLNGALANPGPALIWLPMTLSVTTSASPATYNTTNPITVVGLNEHGDAQTGYFTLTNAGGGEFLQCFLADGTTEALWSQVTSITVPAQLGGGGQFEFGTEDIAPGDAAAIRAAVTSNVGGGNIGYQYASGRVAYAALIQGQILPQVAARIRGATTTAVPLFVMYDNEH